MILNTAQQKAVTHAHGPFLVTAGAGSGKTRVITARISYLLEQRAVSPASIIALTFTNKAAREMLSRIEPLLSHSPERPYIGTFHSYCLWFLKQQGMRCPIWPFTLIDGDDQRVLITKILKEHKLQDEISAAQIVSSWGASQKNNLSAFAEITDEYQAQKKAQKLLDFEDLLLHTLTILTENPDILNQFRTRIRHILVDEYQDTNTIQNRLLKIFCIEKNNFILDSLCAVGDEDQAIYSWRGATVDTIRRFEQDFPGAVSYTISQNYRSNNRILKIANHVIAHNSNRSPKELWSEKTEKSCVRIVSCATGYHEADCIAQILHMAQQAKISLNNCAIMYRTHAQSRNIEEALVRARIGYQIFGGVSFYERAEIKDLLAYMRVLTNPFDQLSLMRIFNCPPRGLGAAAQEKYSTFSHAGTKNFYTIAHDPQFLESLSRAQQAGITQLIQLLDPINSTIKPSEFITHIVTSTEYVNYIRTHYPPEDAESRIDNIREFVRALQAFYHQGVTTCAQVLETITLMQETAAAQDQTSQVSLMTLHATKGLEFKLVIIAGVEENILPSPRSRTDLAQIEEERRLFYVGITRAEDFLILTHAQYRTTYGVTQAHKNSRFLDEIPVSLAERCDVRDIPAPRIGPLFTPWFTYTSAAAIAKPVPKPTTHHRTLNTSSSEAPLKKAATVSHPTFGVGIIESVEKRSDGSEKVTVRFRSGTKKLDSSFLIALR